MGIAIADQRQDHGPQRLSVKLLATTALRPAHAMPPAAVHRVTAAATMTPATAKRGFVFSVFHAHPALVSVFHET